MGERGITDESFITYQKAELVDAVFLQQNSFHDVDGVTHPERLQMMFDMVKKVVDAPVAIQGKRGIRSHFNFLRQSFLDWNYLKPDSDDFNKLKNTLLKLIKQMEHATQDV